MATVKCDKCGKEIIIDETRSFGFCSFCGAKISCNQTTLNNLFDNSIYYMFINISISSSTLFIPPIPKFSTNTLATLGERNAGSVGPK